jgi:hypothetical protein
MQTILVVFFFYILLALFVGEIIYRGMKD